MLSAMWIQQQLTTPYYIDLIHDISAHSATPMITD